LGENGRLRLFAEALLLELFGGGGENDGAEAGDRARFAAPSLPIDLVSERGWVADVGVGSGAGTACVGAFSELMVLDRRFLLGRPLECVLLDGTTGDG
jgi:hypothetical protein